MTELLTEGEDIDQAFSPLSLIFPSIDVDRGLSEDLGAMYNQPRKWWLQGF